MQSRRSTDSIKEDPREKLVWIQRNAMKQFEYFDCFSDCFEFPGQSRLECVRVKLPDQLTRT